ncbi:hypothetical protein GW17_00041485 [Ensete ventricosum]|nr:hypothetical protein GW17_00041485 [Ensete ventricosum]RZS17577.1 hypothetical protein BHM03_00049731 [Ensete ventricosum]
MQRRCCMPLAIASASGPLTQSSGGSPYKWAAPRRAAIWPAGNPPMGTMPTSVAPSGRHRFAHRCCARKRHPYG